MKLRSIAGIAGLCLALVLSGSAQVIENPEKPKAADALRVIVPKVVMTITDESGEFFFKYPRGLKIGPEGSIVFTDGEQVLRFDKDGKFIRNYFKKGQGPGEMTRIDSYEIFQDGRMVIHSFDAPKMIWFDAAGNLEKEITLPPEYRRIYFLGRRDKRWVFDTFDFPRDIGDAKYIELPHRFISWNEATNEWKPLASFNCTVYAASNGGSSGIIDIASLRTASLGEGLFAISHTSEYAIKILDILTNEVRREFRRAYKRVAPPPLKAGTNQPRLGLNGKNYELPEQKYSNDISSLDAVAGRIWVVTSTKDEKKGVLVDVFDVDGTYRDAFYLKLPEAALSRSGSFRFSPTGDAVFTIETTPDETIVIKKYALK